MKSGGSEHMYWHWLVVTMRIPGGTENQSKWGHFGEVREKSLRGSGVRTVYFHYVLFYTVWFLSHVNVLFEKIKLYN